MITYPKISIITPVKNAQQTLEKTIQSLILQNYPNLEYIVIDGNSTDKTAEIIKKYEKHIDHFIKADWSAVKAENEGIKIASGDIIAFLNADDFYEKDVLHKIASEFQQNPQLDIVSCLYRVIEKDENGNYQITETTTPQKMELNKDKIIISYGLNARFFKKNIFEKYGFMIEKNDKNQVFFSNDVEHFVRILLKGNIKNKTIDYIGYNYLSHENSYTFSLNIDKKIQLFEEKIFIAKRFLNDKEIILPEIWKKTFKKWVKKYRTRTIKLFIKKYDFKNAFHAFILGIKENGFFKFSFYLLKTMSKNW